MLHNKVLVVLIDSTSGNTAFACQRYWAQVWINKLVLNNVNNMTSTYIKAIKPVDKTVSDKHHFWRVNLIWSHWNKNIKKYEISDERVN